MPRAVRARQALRDDALQAAVADDLREAEVNAQAFRGVRGLIFQGPAEVDEALARIAHEVRLTRNTAADDDRSWSPDAERIVFTSGRRGLNEVFVMRADGTDQRRVTWIPAEHA